LPGDRVHGYGGGGEDDRQGEGDVAEVACERVDRAVARGTLGEALAELAECRAAQGSGPVEDEEEHQAGDEAERRPRRDPGHLVAHCTRP
jgi:hypothetical protein